MFLLILLSPSMAEAYIGPGMGAGSIGVVLGVLLAIGLALFAILWYPLKRMLKKKKDGKTEDVKEKDNGAA